MSASADKDKRIKEYLLKGLLKILSETDPNYVQHLAEGKYDEEIALQQEMADKILKKKHDEEHHEKMQKTLSRSAIHLKSVDLRDLRTPIRPTRRVKVKRGGKTKGKTAKRKYKR